ncbi:MAG: hypothetical protein LBR53_02265 [Deltaproteobacteria bacterium]|nr:hypothetical protein [Deltaproteobacteria bacterium]
MFLAAACALYAVDWGEASADSEADYCRKIYEGQYLGTLHGDSGFSRDYVVHGVSLDGYATLAIHVTNYNENIYRLGFFETTCQNAYKLAQRQRRDKTKSHYYADDFDPFK